MSRSIMHVIQTGQAWVGRAALAAAVALGAAGCEATFSPPVPRLAVEYEETGALVPAPSVPANIWAYPRVQWEGGYAYLVGHTWYYPSDQGWMVFRREPLELWRQRRRIGRGRYGEYGYPPSYAPGTYPPSYSPNYEYGYPR